MLLNIVINVFSVVLYWRIVPFVEAKLENIKQGGFQHKSMIGEIFSIRRISEKMRKLSRHVCMLFVYF